MKHNILDGLQVMLAIIITTSLVVVNAAPLPQKQVNKPVHHTAVAKPVETPAPATPQPAQEAVPAPEAVVEPAPVETPVQTAPVASQPVYSGSHEDMMAAAGISSSDYAAVDYIVMHEGHYDPCVVNGGAVDCSYAINGGQKAYGVCQALPGSKMASAGDDWATNPVTQLRWCASYASKYGGWWSSYYFWIANNWW